MKKIYKDQFIFYTNYESKKSQEFCEHDQISALIFWDKTNIQIRLKANISKTSQSDNKKYFKSRSSNKNALAISSSQSQVISSYEAIIKKYDQTISSCDLKRCPEFWGGYSFIPYEIEFWEGHENRLNKRNLFKLNNKNWDEYILEP